MTTTTDAVVALRTHWTTRFIDTVAVERVTSRGTFNATTLAYDTPSEGAIYTGAALVRPGDNIDRSQYGDQLVTGLPILVYVPHDAAVFQVEDSIEVTACGYDAELVGKTLTVVGFEYDSYQTRQRLVCRIELGSGYVE